MISFLQKLLKKDFPGDSSDFRVLGAYGNLKIIENYKIQPFLIGEIQTEELNRYTIGVYIAGNMSNFSHEIEGAYQIGQFQMMSI